MLNKQCFRLRKMQQLSEELLLDYVLGMYYPFGICYMALCFPVVMMLQLSLQNISDNIYLKLQHASKITNRMLGNQEVMLLIQEVKLTLGATAATLVPFKTQERRLITLIPITKGASNQTNL